MVKSTFVVQFLLLSEAFSSAIQIVAGISVVHLDKCHENAWHLLFSGKEMWGLKPFDSSDPGWPCTIPSARTSGKLFLFSSMQHKHTLNICLLSSHVSRSSPTPRAQWMWAAHSFKAGSASRIQTLLPTYHCTSTTRRSRIRETTSVRSSSPTVLAWPNSSVWKWKVQPTTVISQPRRHDSYCSAPVPQSLLLFRRVLCRGSLWPRGMWVWAARPAPGSPFLCTSGRKPVPPQRSSSLLCLVSCFINISKTI